MTGEITLRGKVLPVGGIKEKILAAKRVGLTEIIISEQNEKDLKEIEEIYLKGINFHFVRNMMDVIDLTLEKGKVTQ
jgi:ATP-dependent Lon protease